MAARTICIRKVPERLFRHIKGVKGLTNREMLVVPFAEAYPLSPLEVIEAVRRYARERGVAYEEVVASAADSAAKAYPWGVLDSVKGEAFNSMSVMGVEDAEYDAWRVTMARDGRTVSEVLLECFEKATPFLPGDVVKAAKALAGEEGLVRWAKRYVNLRGLPPGRSR